MSAQPPVIVWFRRDLRLADHPALHAATASGAPVIPLYVLDGTPGVRAPGAASLWWLEKSLAALAAELEARGSRLILRRGPAAKIVAQLVESTGATAVYWNRLYDGGAVARDTGLKTELERCGLAVSSCNGALLVEPWTLKTKTGGPFKVFTPFWNALRQVAGDLELNEAPERLIAPPEWPKSDGLGGWALHPTKPDWSAGFDIWTPGEAGAYPRLHDFIDNDLKSYPRARDEPAS